jgi:hypothetical protein
MQIATIGLDLAKHWFQVHGVDGNGHVVVRRRLWRSGVIAYFRSLERAGRWDDASAPPALLHHQPGEMRKPVVLDRARQQPAGQDRRQDSSRTVEIRDGPAVRPHGAVGSAPRRDSPRSPPEERQSALR